MKVCATFIRIHGRIINVAHIVDVFSKLRSEGDKTFMTLSISKDAVHQWNGDIVDEIWEILQAASAEHLDPHDKLREIAVL